MTILRTVAVLMIALACTRASLAHDEPTTRPATRPTTGPGAHLDAKLRKDFFDAAAAGDVKTMAAMLDAEPLLVDARPDNDHRTPLIITAWRNQPEAAKCLIDRGADLEAEDLVWGASALGWSAWFGRPKVAEVIIAAGAEINHPNRDGTTPLGSAMGAEKHHPKQGEGQATDEERAALHKLLTDHDAVPKVKRVRPWPIVPGWDDIKG